MDYNTVTVQFGRIARHLIIRDEDEEKKCQSAPNLCEKPGTSDKSTPIIIGSILGVIVFGAVAVLTFLHLRRKRKDEEEWPKNNQELDDYGFTAPTSSVRQPQNAHYSQSQQRHHDQDNLERSLRGGQTTGAFRRQEEQISADMKPVDAADRV